MYLAPAGMKNKHAIYRLLAANTVSSFAQGISLIAIPWYFTSILNEEEFYASALAIITICTLPLSLYSGTLIDRFSRKQIFLFLNLAGFTVLSGAATYGFLYGHVPNWMAIGVLAFSLFTFQIHYPNLYAFGQEVIGKESYGRFSSMIEIQNQATIILSGVVSILLLPGQESSTFSLRETLGLHFEPLDLHHIFLMDGFTYALAYLIISQIYYEPDKVRNIELGSVMKRLSSGLNYLKARPRLFLFGVVSHCVFVVVIVHGFYLVNLYIDNYLMCGPSVYALSEVLYSVGAMLAGFLVRRAFRKVNPVKAILIMMAMAASMYFLVSFTRFYAYMLLFQLIIGISNAGIRVMRTTYLMSIVDNDVIGRSESIFNAINITLRFSMISLCSLVYFSRGDYIVHAYFACGIFILLAMGILIWLLKSEAK